MEETQLLEGAIRAVVHDRLFGFIDGQDGRQYFFHLKGLADGVRFDELERGQHVEFKAVEAPKGPRATHVKLLASAE